MVHWVLVANRTHAYRETLDIAVPPLSKFESKEKQALAKIFPAIGRGSKLLEQQMLLEKLIKGYLDGTAETDRRKGGFKVQNG